MAEGVQRGRECGRPVCRAKDRAEGNGPDVGLVDRAHRGERRFTQNRMVEPKLARVLGLLVEQVGLRTEEDAERHHELLANGVDGRVRDLREELAEVREEQLRPLGEHGERRVVAHGPHRFFACLRHGRENHPQLLARVPEGTLETSEGVGGAGRGRGLGDRWQHDALLLHPPAIGTQGDELRLHLFVVEQTPQRRVDDQHAAGLEAALRADAVTAHRERARLGREHDAIVIRHQPPRGAQPVAVEHRADLPPIRERDRGRPVPRLHQRRVVLVKRAPLGRHRRVALPCLRHEHRHRMREWTAAKHEQLEHTVERGGVALPFGDDRQQRFDLVAEAR